MPSAGNNRPAPAKSPSVAAHGLICTMLMHKIASARVTGHVAGADESSSTGAARLFAGSGLRATPSRRRPKTSEAVPVLERLPDLYTQLFGAVFRPLKRGISQDLLQAHADVFAVRH